MQKLLITIAVTLGSVAGMLGTGEASALPTAELWTSRYNGPGNSLDRAVSVAASPDGRRVFVIGESFGPNREPEYATIAYRASTGAQLWASRFSGSAKERDYPYALAVSPDGTMVFVTGGDASDATGYDYATIAYEASTGARIWARRYNGPGNDEDIALALTVGSDGNRLFVTGSSTAGNGRDYTTLSYDTSTGAKLWASRYDGPDGESDNDYPWAIASSPDGSKVFVTGESYGAIGSGYATLAYDAATGDRLWLKRYEFNPVDNSSRARSIAVSPDGKTVFVTGESAGQTHSDYATLAYDTSTGHTRWERRYDGSGRGAAAPSLAVSPDGTAVFVTGESAGSTGLFDYGTVAYDASTGHKLWDKRYDGPAGGNDSASSIGVSPDGTKVFVTGNSVGPTSAADYETLAYDATSGDKLWAERYNGPASGGDYAISIAVSPGGTRVIVTGMSRGLGTCRICDDFATIAYAA